MGAAAPGGGPGDRRTSRRGYFGPGHEPLPAALDAALAEFCRHLAAERSLSRHTVRAYRGDIRSLLDYAARPASPTPASST